jgi:hypothetical protein
MHCLFGGGGIMREFVTAIGVLVIVDAGASLDAHVASLLAGAERLSARLIEVTPNI